MAGICWCLGPELFNIMVTNNINCGMWGALLELYLPVAVYDVPEYFLYIS